jgi:hypothetical protein
MTSLDLATLDDIVGAGNFVKDWMPDVRAVVLPGAASALAGAACFGGVSIAAGGTFFAPPAAPIAVSIGAHAMSFGCGAVAATVVRHYMNKKK